MLLFTNLLRLLSITSWRNYHHHNYHHSYQYDYYCWQRCCFFSLVFDFVVIFRCCCCCCAPISSSCLLVSSSAYWLLIIISLIFLKTQTSFGSLSVEFKWQQVFLGLQHTSQYSNRSYFLFLLAFSQVMRERSNTNYNWYNCYPHVPRLFQLSGIIQLFINFFCFLLFSFLLCGLLRQ